MGASAIFYILSVMLSLYCTYLVSFRTYRMEYSLETHKDEPTDERIVYPRVVYLLLIALCFAPVANAVLCFVFMAVSVAERRAGEFYVKSWLFETPEKTRKKD